MDFFDVKGVVEELIEALAVPGLTFEPGAHDDAAPRAHGAGAGRRRSGRMGRRTASGRRRALRSRGAGRDRRRTRPGPDSRAGRSTGTPTRPVPVYPPVKEDLAFVLDRSVPVARVREVIANAGGPMLAGATLFDEYAGEQVGAGKRSLAFSLTYQAPDRTLTDADARRSGSASRSADRRAGSGAKGLGERRKARLQRPRTTSGVTAPACRASAAPA